MIDLAVAHQAIDKVTHALGMIPVHRHRTPAMAAAETRQAAQRGLARALRFIGSHATPAGQFDFNNWADAIERVEI